MTTTKEKLLQLAVVLVITVPIAVVVWFIVAPDKNDANPAATLPPPSATSRSTSTPSTTPAPSTEPKPAQTFPPEHQPIVDAYFGYWDTFYALRAATDLEIRTALSPFATPERVEKIVSVFAEFRAAGKVPGGTPHYRPITVTTSNGEALVFECHDSSEEGFVDTETGEPLEYGSPRLRLETELVLDQASSRWLVSQAFAEKDTC